LLEHALAVRQERLARYCRPIEPAFLALLEARRPRSMADVSAAWYGERDARAQRYHASRYHGLNLNSLFFRGTIEFRYFNGTLHAGEVKAYVQLVLALAAKALTGRAASSKRRAFDPATAKYDFRVFLLNLGLIGDEFKTARLHLTKHLGGSAAWKGERRDRRPRAAAPPPAGEAEGEVGRGFAREAA
ncbi:MAG TPA: amidoligase family protein, partial [Polyangiaceae bacterium]|nr:amidoligase family protein [Polyangiaceae bacterium]